jgi:hypothetical protein
MTVLPSHLTRAAGLSAIASGLLYIAIQPIHPEETVSAVTGTAWAVVGAMTIAMAVLALAGITGIYLRQVTESGLLGLVGYLVFASFFFLAFAFTFAEIFILPQLADESPRFVDSFNSIFAGEDVAMDLGALELLAPVAAVLYMGGGALFGLAVFRARVLDRRAGLALTVGALAALLAAVLPHEVGRYAAVPLGLAMIWLGHSLRNSTVIELPAAAIPEARSGTAASSSVDRV